MLDIEQVAHLVEVVGPSRIGAVPAKKGLGVEAAASRDRFDVGDGLAAARNRVPLTIVLDSVEEVSELASRFGRSDFGHGISLSDYDTGGALTTSSPHPYHRNSRAGPTPAVRHGCPRSAARACASPNTAGGVARKEPMPLAGEHLGVLLVYGAHKHRH